MKKSKLVLYTGALMLATGITFFTACKKNDTTKDTTEDTSYASDQALAERTFDDAQDIADKAYDTPSGSGAFKTSSCATVSHSGTTITVDFGPSNCLCTDGRERRGKIIINYTGAYPDSGSVHTITFDNYYVNDNKVEGTKTVTNMGTNSSGQPYFNIAVDGTVIRTSGVSIHTVASRVRTWVAGYTTLGDRSDDVYNITGTGTVTRPAGTMTTSITGAAPLVVALSCNWIEAGTITYTLPSGLTRTLNYGDTPACDNMADLTLASGTVVHLTLP